MDIVALARDYLAKNAAESGADVLIKDMADEIERLRQACEASWQMGHKIYHNANAHEASIDWAQVRGMLAGVLGKTL
jgi:hypothetical protein